MPKTRELPQTPEQLLGELFVIFPQYRARYTGPIHDDTPSFHSILIDLSAGTALATASEAQLLAFAALVNAAVENGGLLENAFSTCLLEHLGQIKALKVLRPHLSKTARERTRA